MPSDSEARQARLALAVFHPKRATRVDAHWVVEDATEHLAVMADLARKGSTRKGLECGFSCLVRWQSSQKGGVGTKSDWARDALFLVKEALGEATAEDNERHAALDKRLWGRYFDSPEWAYAQAAARLLDHGLLLLTLAGDPG